MQLNKDDKPSWLDRPVSAWFTLNLESVLFIVLLIFAVITRFWDLEPRVMSHDENSHVYFSWQLSEGQGYKHDPVTHGPFQFHVVALSYLLFGDSDTTARIPAALFSIATAAFMWQYRRYLGRAGALVAMLLLIISPYMLYYGRYVRNEAFVAFWVVMMIWAVLRYLETGEERFALGVTLANVLHFTTKETSYIAAAQILLFLAGYFYLQMQRRAWPQEAYRSRFIGSMIAGLMLGAVGGGLWLINKRLAAIATQSAAQAAAAQIPAGEAVGPIHPYIIYLLLGVAGAAILFALHQLIVGNRPEGTSEKETQRFSIAYAAIFALLAAALGYAMFFVRADSALMVALAEYNSLPATTWVDRIQPTINIALQLIPSLLLGGTLFYVGRLAMRLPAKVWPTGRGERSFDLIFITGSLLLPLLSAFLIEAIGGQAIDYSNPGMVKSAAVIIPVALLSIGIGVGWNRDVWLKQAAVFYGVFTVFYTTLFSNGQGFFTGLVGSLGYWMEQQGETRGEQPWYFYALIQIPFYEFLPLAGCFLALWIAAKRQQILQTLLPQWMAHGPAVTPPSEEAANPASPASSRKKIAAGGGAPPSGWIQPPVLSLTGFWAISSLLAYSYAGEKMPWLTVHITLPMILVTGWAVGYLIETTHWAVFRTGRGWLGALLSAIFAFSFFQAMAMLLGGQLPFQGKELAQLQDTASLVIAVAVSFITAFSIVILLKEWPAAQIRRLYALSIFGFLALITARSAFIASYINYDRPVEFLVYAHSATGVKEALAQIEEISRRTTGGLDIQVAYDSPTTYPYWWYLRNYPNQKFFGNQPDISLRDAPVILVGIDNFAAVDQIVRRTHYQFEYQRIWWPIEDYKGKSNKVLSWDEFIYPFLSPAMRSAIFKIWWNRDYSDYAKLSTEIKGYPIDLSLPKWSPANAFRLYVRKDIANQLWDYGTIPEVDPYEGKAASLAPAAEIGSAGIDPGQFNRPRALAVAPDGTLYVADTGNHRIQHLTAEGEVLGFWGNFGDINSGAAPIGAFNEPWGIAVAPDGSVFVADTWNFRIQKFTAGGQAVKMWESWSGGPEGLPNTFYGPRDIAIDAEGRVFVTDTGNKRVVVFDSNGNYLFEIGQAGFDPGQFNEPVGLTIDQGGLLWVADTWNQRVQSFAATTFEPYFFPLDAWDVLAWDGESLDNKPYIAVAANGHVFVSDPEGYRILEFDASGAIIRYWGDDNGPGQLNLPTGLAFDADGGLWVADAGSSRLLRFELP